METIVNFDIRQCEGVFLRETKPRAYIMVILSNLNFRKASDKYFVHCTDKNGVEFINVLKLDRMMLFVWKYYKGCMCTVERRLKSYPNEPNEK